MKTSEEAETRGPEKGIADAMEGTEDRRGCVSNQELEESQEFYRQQPEHHGR